MSKNVDKRKMRHQMYSSIIETEKSILRFDSANLTRCSGSEEMI